MPEHRREAFATPALANERFYGAFNALDADAMHQVWRDAPYIACAHPGRVAVYGDEVGRTWAAIFEHGSGMQVTFADERIHVSGSIAIITGTEEVLNFLVSASTARLAVTNVYEYDPGAERWYCILHHSAPCAPE